MATAYTARAAENNYPAKTRPANGVIVQQLAWTGAATVAINDTIDLCKIPANALITDLMLGLTGFDTNASPTATISLGLTKPTANESDIDPVGFLNAATARNGANGALKYSSPSDFNGALAFPYLAAPDGAGPNIPSDGIHSKLTLKVGSAPATAGTTPKVTGWIQYVMDSDWSSASN